MMATIEVDHKTSVFKHSCIKSPLPYDKNSLSDVLIGYGTPETAKEKHRVSKMTGNSESRPSSKSKIRPMTSTRSRTSSSVAVGNCNTTGSTMRNNAPRPSGSLPSRSDLFDTDSNHREENYISISKRDNDEVDSSYCHKGHFIFKNSCTASASCVGQKYFEKLKQLDYSSQDYNDISHLCESIEKVKKEHRKTLKKIENLYNQTQDVGMSFSGQYSAEPAVDSDINYRDMDTQIASKDFQSPMSINSTSNVNTRNMENHRNENDMLNMVDHHKTAGNDKVAPRTKYAWEDKTSKMLGNYSIDNYAKHLSRIERLQQTSSPSTHAGNDRCHPHITVPIPFNMTVRDELKPKVKTKAQLEIEKEKLEKQKAEEAECQKVFRAKPPPAHIYVPLYDAIMIEQEARRSHVRAKCKDMLLSQQMPFSFVLREEERNKHRVKQQAECAARSRKQSRSASPVFKARPPPKIIYDGETKERIQEQEFLRKIKIQMRSLEMLASSNLPPRMAEHQKRKHRKDIELKKSQPWIDKPPSFKPEIHDVPDFQNLHKNLQKMKSKPVMYTVCKPFNLRTDKIKSKIDHIINDIVEDDKRLKETRWPFTGTRERSSSSASLRSRSASVGCIPARISSSAMKQQDLVRYTVKKNYMIKTLHLLCLQSH